MQPSCHQSSPAAPSLPGNSLAGLLVADALPLFRHGLLHLLAQDFASRPLYEAATTDELLAATSGQRPAVVLLPASLARTPAALPGLLAQLHERHPLVRTIVFLEPAAALEATSLHALRQQAAGLLTRAAAPAQVCDCVRAALQPDGPPTAPAAPPVWPGSSLPAAPAGGFTSRQLDILHLIAEDWSNEEIADSLCMSVRTVEYHRSQMLHRAGTRSSLGLVLFAQRQGLLTLAGPPPLLPAARPAASTRR